MCTYFNTKTDVAQNLVDDVFLILTVRGPFHSEGFKLKKYGVVVTLQQEIFYNIFILRL